MTIGKFVLFLCLFTFGLTAWSEGALAQTPPQFIFPDADPILYPGLASPSLGSGTLPERLALIIGINEYNQNGTLGIPELKNAENDALEVTKVLKSAGFYTWPVTSKAATDSTPPHYVTRNDILNAVAEIATFARRGVSRVGRPPVVLIYYAGHGFTYEGKNYIVPSDFAPKYVDDIPEMAISLDELSGRLSWGAPALKIIILDACRTPFPLDVVNSNEDQSIKVNLGSVVFSKSKGKGAKGKDDIVIGLSTREGDAAADSGANDKDGLFTGNFISVLKEALLDAQTTKSGANTSLHSLIHKLKNRMPGGPLDHQQAEFDEDGANDFVLFPTETDYHNETTSWNGSLANVSQALKSLPIAEIVQRTGSVFFCNARSFLDSASYYSYYGAAALDLINEYEKNGTPDCPVALGAINPGAAKDAVVKQDSGNWAHNGEIANQPMRSPTQGQVKSDRSSIVRPRFAQLESPTTQSDASRILLSNQAPEPPRVRDLLNSGISDSAKTEVSKLGVDTRLDRIAVNNGVTGIYQTPSFTGKPFASIDDGELVEVQTIIAGPSLSGHNGDLTQDDNLTSGALKIRTSANIVGFVSQRPVDLGKVAIKFRASVDTHSHTVAAENPEVVSTVLRSGLLANIFIQYPKGSKITGYSAAVDAANAFMVVWRVNDERLIVPVPRYVEYTAGSHDDPDEKKMVISDPDEKPADKLQVIVYMTLLPLEKAIRQKLTSLTSLYADPSEAYDLDKLYVPQVAGPNGDTAASVALDVTTKPKCDQAISATLVSLKNIRVKAYTHFSPESAGKENLTTIRKLLKSAGFNVPASSEVKEVPRNNEVRICADQYQPAAQIAVNLLNACELGPFVPKQLRPCSRLASAEKVEVWLGLGPH